MSDYDPLDWDDQPPLFGDDWDDVGNDDLPEVDPPEWLNQYLAAVEPAAPELPSDEDWSWLDEPTQPLAPAEWDTLFAASVEASDLTFDLPTSDLELDAALATLGLTTATDLPIALDSPPYLMPGDPQTQIWFGVLQPDPTDQDHCFMGILSANQAGEKPEVLFAPCMAGDYADCFMGAQEFMDMAERSDVSFALSRAVDLAQQTQQREAWQGDLGTPLPPSATESVIQQLPDLDL